MVTKPSDLQPLDIIPGVEPSTDQTAFATRHFVLSDKIRFVSGFPEKIGGFVSTSFDGDNTIVGVPRTIYSQVTNNLLTTMVGTHSRLYGLIGSTLTNISPLIGAPTTIANSLATLYGTLASNPISTVNGSTTVTIADTSASRLRVGDSVKLSGATTTNGILNTTLNATHVVRSIGVNSYTIVVGDTANANGSGGGASVVRATGLVNVTAAAHGQVEGDRCKIAGAASFGGVLNTDLNKEFIIRNVATNSFDIMTAGMATSSVSSGGGASTSYDKQIAAGNIDERNAIGYGAGRYGTGLYGTARTSTSGRRYPRIWFFGQYGDAIIGTPGNQGSLYTWGGDTTVAPVVVTNAPTDIDYAFVSDSSIVTFRKNRIRASDIGDSTVWASSSTNQAYDDYIEGAGNFWSHLPFDGYNLIFTNFQTYSFRYIGGKLVWEIKQISRNIGMISPRAGIVVNGIGYWMGTRGWYRWNGGAIETLPSNTKPRSTILKYIFQNLTQSQQSKIFCWYNEEFEEIWWHIPSANSNEPDTVARVNVNDLTWVPDTFNRTAAEYPAVLNYKPLLASYDGTLYRHEVGMDANGAAMTFSLRSRKFSFGKKTGLIVGYVPDSIQVGNISVRTRAYLYPQSVATAFDATTTVTPTTEYISLASQGRLWDYEISGSTLGQSWRAGVWQEMIQPGAMQ